MALGPTYRTTRGPLKWPLGLQEDYTRAIKVALRPTYRRTTRGPLKWPLDLQEDYTRAIKVALVPTEDYTRAIKVALGPTGGLHAGH